MKIKDIAFKSEDTGMKAWSLASLMLAVNEAIFCGGYDVSAYEGAMHQLVCMAHEIEGETRAITDDLFSALQQERATKVNRGEM